MRYYILLFGILMLQIGTLSAKNQERIQAVQGIMERNGEQVYVSFVLTVDGMSRNDILTITPTLLGRGDSTTNLPSINFGTRRAQIMKWRESKDRSALTTFYRRQGEMVYTYSFKYEKWMDGGSLRLNTSITGCCLTRSSQIPILSDLKLATPVEQFIPVVANVPPITPVAEVLAKEHRFLVPWTGSIDRRDQLAEDRDDATLVIYFPVGKSNVVPEFRGNKANLDRLIAVLRQVSASNDSRIAKILVVGSASPEGPESLNNRLAAGRAKMLLDYITTHTRIDPSFFEVYNAQGAWHGLRKLADESHMPFRDEVLDIIDYTPIAGATPSEGRMASLRALKNGVPYQYMKDVFFPQLRNAGYIKVYYETQQDPMLEVVNKAIELIHEQQYDQALTLLQSNTHVRADNLRGVCYMMTGETATARSFFEQAVANGDSEAPKNLQQLEDINND